MKPASTHLIKNLSVSYSKGKRKTPEKTTNKNNIIPFQRKMKILGIIFDSKLNGLPHVNSNSTKAQQNYSDCTHITDVVRIHRFIIKDIQYVINKLQNRLRLNNIQGNQPKTLKNDKTHTGIRLAFGLFKSSQIESLRNIAFEYSLDLRRTMYCITFTLCG